MCFAWGRGGALFDAMWRGCWVFGVWWVCCLALCRGVYVYSTPRFTPSGVLGVATFRKRGKSWRVEVCVDGVRSSKSFATKSEAAGWALRKETEPQRRALSPHTLADAMRRYADVVSPRHKGERWERIKIGTMLRDWPAVERGIGSITGADIADWRDARLAQVAPATVAREMTLIRCVFEVARRDWQWIEINPMQGVRRPQSPPSRKRRVPDDEIEAMLGALNYRRGEVPVTQSQRVAVAFLLSLETAMRSGELLGMTWGDVREKSVRLPRTKNGDARDVPLSPAARELLALFPHDSATVIGVRPASRDALFRKARAKAEAVVPSVASLHFHDARAEAIWRLSGKLHVLDLARVIGHRDPSSLMLYYNASADDLADLL